MATRFSKQSLSKGPSARATGIRRYAVAAAALLLPVGLAVGFAPAIASAATPAPVVTAVHPSSGAPTGGTPVLIGGENLLGATAIDFGTTAAPEMIVISNSEAVAVSPAGTGTVDVTVTTPGGTSATSAADDFTYAVATTTVTAVHPDSGPPAGGTQVVIEGTNLTGATAVDFGTAPATSVDVLSSHLVAAVAPAGTGTVDVTVTTPLGTSATSAADHFSYVVPTTTVTAVHPDSGPPAGGTQVVIEGTNLTGATAVDFGTAPATSVDVLSSHLVTATSPAGTGTVDVTVTTPLGTSATSAVDHFSYVVPTTTVTAVRPDTGLLSGGTHVLITGTNLTGATTVDFGTAPATSVDVLSSHLVTAVSPAGTGTVDVTVTTPLGTSATSAADHFTYAAAVTTVRGVRPHSGSTEGGTRVLIIGTNVAGATAVHFGTAPATSVRVLSGDVVLATSPAGTGTVDVTVTTPLGTSATSAADHFTYVTVSTGGHGHGHGLGHGRPGPHAIGSRRG